jgi:hypothetical protein
LANRLQRYAAQTMYAATSGEVLQLGPFPLVMQALQVEQPAAGTLGMQCGGLLRGSEDGIVPQEAFVQRVG